MPVPVGLSRTGARSPNHLESAVTANRWRRDWHRAGTSKSRSRTGLGPRDLTAFVPPHPASITFLTYGALRGQQHTWGPSTL